MLDRMAGFVPAIFVWSALYGAPSVLADISRTWGRSNVARAFANRQRCRERCPAGIAILVTLRPGVSFPTALGEPRQHGAVAHLCAFGRDFGNQSVVWGGDGVLHFHRLED